MLRLRYRALAGINFLLNTKQFGAHVHRGRFYVIADDDHAFGLCSLSVTTRVVTFSASSKPQRPPAHYCLLAATGRRGRCNNRNNSGFPKKRANGAHYRRLFSHSPSFQMSGKRLRIMAGGR